MQETEPVIPGRFEGPGVVDLRRHAARGTVINAIYLTGLYTLGLIQGYVVAIFLTPSDYGVWGIVIIGLSSVLWLRTIGIGDKYIQQDEADQELAFQKAFTLEVIFTSLFTLAALAAIPVIVAVYGQPRIVLPALVAVAAFPAVMFQSPLWVYYRRMEFARQRRLEAINPVTSFVVTVALAAAGLGYWSLAIGFTVGTWAGALVAVRASPYRLRLRFDRSTVREYARFSWPILVASLSGVVIGQAAILTGDRVLGLAAAGAISLASSIASYTDSVDDILTQTLYPAICAVKDRTDLLMETFVKSNRLTLMWGMPFGVGVALFAPDLVHFLLGHRWHGAVGIIRTFGLIAAVHHIAYNWAAYYRARGETRPMAVVGITSAATFVAVAVPLTIAIGLGGISIGMAAASLIGLVGRFYYLSRLFDGLRVAKYVARAIAPTLPAAAVVLIVRAASGQRGIGLALAELVLYILVTLGATVLLERELLKEALGYLRREPGAVPRIVL
jgi:O-antigen/teichoic acid export membrane protein